MEASLSLCLSVSSCAHEFLLPFIDYYYDQEQGTDEEPEPTFSEDEAVTQKGLRRSQSVKLSRSRIRKDVSL